MGHRKDVSAAQSCHEEDECRKKKWEAREAQLQVEKEKKEKEEDIWLNPGEANQQNAKGKVRKCEILYLLSKNVNMKFKQLLPF